MSDPTDEEIEKLIKKRAIKIPNEELEEVLSKRASKVSKDDLKELVKNEGTLISTATSAGPLKVILDDIKLLFSMIKDYASGNYTEIPWASIAAAAAALAYVISPVDLIPDIIPVVGFVDDAAVVTLCLKLIRDDIDTYAKWKGAR